MHGLFIPHSHDASDSIDDAMEASGQGVRAVKISLAVLGATATLQLVVVLISGSVALLADTIHNFSDALTALPLWIAFVLGRRAPTRRYTYGYGRVEDLAGLFILAMIALSAILAGYESIRRLLDPQPLDNLGRVIVAGIIGAAGNEFVALYRIRTGRRIGSAALVADGTHARTDGFTSLAVVFGAVGVWLGFSSRRPRRRAAHHHRDRRTAVGTARDVGRRLLDGVDPEILDQAETALAHIPQAHRVTDVRLRWTGHRLNVDVAIATPGELTLTDFYTIADTTDHALRRVLPSVGSVDVSPISDTTTRLARS